MPWTRLAILGILGLIASQTPMALAQYSGKVAKSGKPEPVLRAVAVLEWTGEPGKPSASRLVPVTVYDGEHLNDGTIYLSRPQPLALSSDVEYELQMAGKPVGMFDIFGAGEVDGVWRGFGAWKPLSAAAAAKANSAFNTSSLYAPVDVKDDSHPVLKRKHPKESEANPGSPTPATTPGSGAGTETSASSSPDKDGAKSAPVDEDRPRLKKKSGEDTASQNAPSTGSASAPAPDVDPERPTIRRSRKSSADEEGMAETAVATPDPDRPKLKRGKPTGTDAAEAPKLTGLPPTMQQAVAVSDAKYRPEHPWKYTWANPDDEARLKSALEAIAQTALGLDPPPVAARKVIRKAVPGRKVAKPVPPLPAPPVDLAEEQFRVFELAYGATATLVLSASSPESLPTAALPPGGKPAARKYVTLIAQPDLYGGIRVLHKNVSDSAHLDETPRMRLVDAVDSMGDNRGELLFELRSQTQRQFALYRVTRGSAEQMFATVAMP